MDVIFSNNPMLIKKKPSIFLAGPTLRPLGLVERFWVWLYGLKLRWRKEALQILTDCNFQGSVLIPEHDDWGLIGNYIGQTEWELQGLEQADVILFWVPRHLRFLPAFTTNIEFGKYIDSGRVVYGRPPIAPKNKYLDWMYKKHVNKPPCDTLQQTIEETLKMLG